MYVLLYSNVFKVATLYIDLYRYICSNLLVACVKAEQLSPSQAQYGSLARQQSEQAFPYTPHRCKDIWVSPASEDTYSCCCKERNSNCAVLYCLRIVMLYCLFCKYHCYIAVKLQHYIFF